MPVQPLIDRLDWCRSTGKDKWIARCPAHDDRSPSLSITEKPDKETGELKPLIHCHAGCGAVDVLVAVGLDWGDILPDTRKHYQAERKQYERTVDELVVEIAKADREAGKVLSLEDREREAEAFARILLDEPSPESLEPLEPNFLAVAERESLKIAALMKEIEDKPMASRATTQTVEEWLAEYEAS